MYLHLVRELLYKIEWPSVRRLRIGILCTYWNFVRALPYYVIESTQSPWDSGSRIDNWFQLSIRRAFQIFFHCQKLTQLIISNMESKQHMPQNRVNGNFA